MRNMYGTGDADWSKRLNSVSFRIMNVGQITEIVYMQTLDRMFDAAFGFEWAQLTAQRNAELGHEYTKDQVAMKRKTINPANDSDGSGGED